VPLPKGQKKERLRQGRIEHNTTQFSHGRRVLRSGGPNHVNHHVHRVHLGLTTKRLKAFPTKERQWATPVAAPVEVSQNHFDTILCHNDRMAVEKILILHQSSFMTLPLALLREQPAVVLLLERA
jgi:hypothetical protein